MGKTATARKRSAVCAKPIPAQKSQNFTPTPGSDSPLAELAEHAYLVHGQERTPW